jgi:hypothetical protein
MYFSRGLASRPDLGVAAYVGGFFGTGAGVTTARRRAVEGLSGTGAGVTTARRRAVEGISTTVEGYSSGGAGVSRNRRIQVEGLNAWDRGLAYTNGVGVAVGLPGLRGVGASNQVRPQPDSSSNGNGGYALQLPNGQDAVAKLGGQLAWLSDAIKRASKASYSAQEVQKIRQVYNAALPLFVAVGLAGSIGDFPQPRSVRLLH